MIDDAKKTAFSRIYRIDAHMNAQRLWQCTQNLRRFKPDGVPLLRGEVSMGSDPQSRSYLQLIQADTEGIRFLQWSLTEYISLFLTKVISLAENRINRSQGGGKNQR